MDKNRAKSYLMTLMVVAESDDQNHPFEMRLIQDIGEKLSLSREEINSLRSFPDISYSVPKDERERMELFYESFFLMKIDGKMEEKEMNILKQIGTVLHLNPLLVEEFILVGKEYLHKPIPEDALLNILRKYMN